MGERDGEVGVEEAEGESSQAVEIRLYRKTLIIHGDYLT